MAPANKLASFFKNQSKKAFGGASAYVLAVTLKNQLIRKGIKYSIALLAERATMVLLTLATWFLNPGEAIFNYIDAHDKRPNSGYIDF